MKINSELIQKLAPYENKISIASKKMLKEKIILDDARKKRLKFINSYVKSLGYENFEETNIACVAPDVMHHIYVPGSNPIGIGRRKCIFCDIDDFDLY